MFCYISCRICCLNFAHRSFLTSLLTNKIVLKLFKIGGFKYFYNKSYKSTLITSKIANHDSAHY